MKLNINSIKPKKIRTNSKQNSKQKQPNNNSIKKSTYPKNPIDNKNYFSNTIKNKNQKSPNIILHKDIKSIDTKQNDLKSITKEIVSLIKDHFYNNKLYIENVKLISDSINEQTLFSRSAINDILLYLNQITNPRFNGSLVNMNEKYMKEKLYMINLRMGKIDKLNNCMLKNIRNNDTSLIAFYEEINNLFHLGKIFLIDDEKKNFNRLMTDINIDKNYYNFESIDFSEIKQKFSDIYSNTKKFTTLNNEKENNLDFFKKEHRSSSEQQTNKKRNDNITKKRPNSFNKSKNLKVNKNIVEEQPKKIIENISKYDLALMVLEFIKKMKQLQEAIKLKKENSYTYKENFEISKRGLKKQCEYIIKNVNNENDNKNIITEYENKINTIEKQYQELNKLIEEKKQEVTSLKNDNIISNKLNDELSEKNKKLLNENQNLSQEITKLNDDISKLNEIKEENGKFKKQVSELKNEINNKINDYNLNNEELKKIKETLIDLNEKSEITIKDIIEKDNKFNLCQKSYGDKINEVKEDDSKAKQDMINEININVKEYEEYLNIFKENNGDFLNILK